MGTVNCALENADVSDNFCQISFKFPFYTEKYPSIVRSCRQVSLNFCTKLRKSTDTPKVPYKPKMLYTLKVLYTPKVLTHQECYTQYTSKEPYKPNVRDKPKLPGNPVPRVQHLCTPDGDNWYDTLSSWWWVWSVDFNLVLYRHMHLAQSKPNARSLPAIGR